MSKVKSSETSLEKLFRKILWKQGIRYRKNNKKYYGKPDLSIKKKKIIIFIDSCFWHGCKKHLRMPSGNQDYWANKINRNKKRDKEVNLYYKKINWEIIRIWEHNLKDESKINQIIKKIKII